MSIKKEQIGRHCPYCDAMVTYDEYFCRACHKRIFDQNQLDAPSTLAPETYVVGLRRVYFSALLSIIGVGLAQFYNGDTLKGVAFFGAFLLVAFGGIGGSQYHALLYFGIWIAATCEGIYSAWEINQYKKPYAGKSLLIWAELGFLALIVVLHFVTGIPDVVYLGKFFPLMDLWMVL
ncbi:MAG: hypothetical protein CVV30_11850 [Methanomicrobiales archaeon HGW-Methanomicrobiales-1]|jgi:TM2 domain-containing membrane protein YozV|nr:MAG: hypothetical protein CVV30_11850 [Methanomicrobiales archaeon HGW-Methanomicrobiales-1]